MRSMSLSIRNGSAAISIFAWSALAVPLVAIAATTQSPLQQSYFLLANNDPSYRFRTASAFTCSLFGPSGGTCKFEWTVADISEFSLPYSFNWSGINLQGAFTNAIIGSIRSRTWTAQISNTPPPPLQNPAKSSGSMRILGSGALFNQSETPEYYSHPASVTPGLVKGLFERAGDFFSLSTTLEENPLLVDFTSSVERIVGDQFRYDYKITNATNHMLSYVWEDVDLEGDLDANSMIVESVISDLPPAEIYGFISATVLADDFRGPATTLIPFDAPAAVPVPATIMLFAGGLLIMPGLTRGTRALSLRARIARA